MRSRSRCSGRHGSATRTRSTSAAADGCSRCCRTAAAGHTSSAAYDASAPVNTSGPAVIAAGSRAATA